MCHIRDALDAAEQDPGCKFTSTSNARMEPIDLSADHRSQCFKALHEVIWKKESFVVLL